MELTNIHYSSYNKTKWEIYSSRVLLLEAFGPNLPRPYADVIKGSKRYKNLKELRAQTLNHILRVVFYFDHKRNAFLLTGGDKKGKNEGRFYKDLIAEAEIIIKKHEKEIRK